LAGSFWVFYKDGPYKRDFQIFTSCFLETKIVIVGIGLESNDKLLQYRKKERKTEVYKKKL